MTTRLHCPKRFLSLLLTIGITFTGCMTSGPGDELDNSATGPTSETGGESHGSSSTDTLNTNDTSGTESARCPDRVWSGDVSIQESSDIGYLQGVTKIAGHLNISVSGNMRLDALSCLESIDGQLILKRAPHPSESLDLEGFRNLLHIGGDLAIRGLRGEFRLSGFRSLASIGGQLEIRDTETLQTLDGLQSLRTVGQSLTIGKNAALRSLAGLESLDSVGELIIAQNPNLNDLSALSALTSVSRVQIADNSALASLTGLRGIRQLDTLEIRNLTSLAQLQGLEQLRDVHTELWIESNPALVDLRGLDGLLNVGQGLYILENAALTTLDGIGQLQGGNASRVVEIARNHRLVRLAGLGLAPDIPGTLIVRDNPLLTDLSRLNAIEHIGALYLRSEATMPSLEVFSQLRSIGHLDIEKIPTLVSIQTQQSDLQIHSLRLAHLDVLETLPDALRNMDALNRLELTDLPGIENFEELQTLTHIRDSITLRELPQLVDLEILTKLQTISGTLTLDSLAQLTSLTGLENVEQLGGLNLVRLNALKSMTGFPNINALNNGQLCIHDLPQLTDLSHLRKLTEIAGAFSMTNNPRLQTLDGLDGLLRVGASLWIDSNSSLLDIRALKNLREIGGQNWGVGDNCADAFKGRHGFMGIELRALPITSIEGLSGIESIAGGLAIKENPELVSLAGIKSPSLAGFLYEVRDNEKLSRCEINDLLDRLEIKDPDLQAIVENNLPPELDECTAR